jgi:hypothetical protein
MAQIAFQFSSMVMNLRAHDNKEFLKYQINYVSLTL